MVHVIHQRVLLVPSLHDGRFVGQVEVSAVITEQSVSHEAPVVRKAQGMGWDPWHRSRFTSEVF